MDPPPALERVAAAATSKDEIDPGRGPAVEQAPRTCTEPHAGRSCRPAIRRPAPSASSAAIRVGLEEREDSERRGGSDASRRLAGAAWVIGLSAMIDWWSPWSVARIRSAPRSAWSSHPTASWSAACRAVDHVRHADVPDGRRSRGRRPVAPPRRPDPVEVPDIVPWAAGGQRSTRRTANRADAKQ